MQNAIKNNSLVTHLKEDQNLRVKLLHGIYAAFAFFALLYLFLLGSAVLNIVERKSLEVKAHDLSNQIGELELKYLQVSGTIDRNLSESMGFEEIAQNFATRQAVTLKLAKNEI